MTFPEVFVRRAMDTPNGQALEVVRFVNGEPITTSYSWGRLLRAVKGASAMLVELGVTREDRVILSASDPAIFLSFLLGAQCIGAIPVPVPSLSEIRPRHYTQRIAAVSRDATPRAAIVDDPRALEPIPSALREDTSFRAVPASSVIELENAPGEFEPARCSREIAFLQYTSGSTGSPKGVVVLHANVLANLRAIVDGGFMDSRDVVFSWLPLFHDMGLIAGLLLGLYLGIPTYVTPPRTFITRPESWLRAVTRFRATFSPGPNFAFDVLAHRVPEKTLLGIDLSSWRLAFDGGELVDPETVRAFTARYRSFGFREESFRPAYGLAEATLAAAFPPPGMPVHFDDVDRSALALRGTATPSRPGAAHTATYASVGIAVPGHSVRILDPSDQCELPNRHVGEIAISGPSVTPGYFKDLLAGAPVRSELRTGDLGYIANGQLYVVDRLKDLIVIAGAKYAPADIESVVGGLDGIRPDAVAAFSARGAAGTEILSVLVGLDARGSKMKEQVAESVRREIFAHFGLTTAEVILVRPSDIPKTSSGKIRRAECRAVFESRRAQFAIGD